MSRVGWVPGDRDSAIAPVVEAGLRRALVEGYDPRRLIGVSLDGCADAIGTERLGAMRRSAHAHTAAGDSFRGWVCFKGGERRVTRRLFAHELAHVLVYSGHTAAWGRAVGDLGAPGESRHVRARRPAMTWYWTDPDGTRRAGSHREMMEALT